MHRSSSQDTRALGRMSKLHAQVKRFKSILAHPGRQISSKHGIQPQGNERTRFLNQTVPRNSYVCYNLRVASKEAHFFASACVLKGSLCSGEGQAIRELDCLYLIPASFLSSYAALGNGLNLSGNDKSLSLPPGITVSTE